MKRRVLCMLLVLAMAVTCLAGCNRKKSVRVVIGSSSTSGDSYLIADTVTRYLAEEMGWDAKVDPVGAAEMFEILRTERLDSREEAEALLAQLQSGATYTVTLDQSSEIQLAGNLTDTFRPAAGGTFTDVPATHWAAGAVAFVSSQGLLQGISADTFAPGQPMTRAMLVTALWREAGSPVVNYAMDFDDVDEDQWYTEAVRWAASEGIVTGTGKGFSPDAALTRESLAAILFRYAGGQADADQLGSYADGAGVSAWAREAMNWAVAQGLITGKSGGRLDPGGTASRAEVSAILMRYVQSAQA